MAAPAAIHIQEQTSHYNTHKTYTVYFNGVAITTTVTSNNSVVSNWISSAKSTIQQYYSISKPVVGLDVEWQPNFNRGSRRQNPVATVQLCVANSCLIYQIIHSPNFCTPLLNFLADPYFTFVGVGVNADLAKLVDNYGIGGDARTVELGSLAADAYGREELRTAGLKELVRVVMAAEMEKPRRVTLSNWANPWLTNEQVQYACVDAYVSFEIGSYLNADDYYNFGPH